MIANRISHRLLGTLCERVGIAFDVGHDPHKIFLREAAAARTRYGKRMGQIAKHVEAGGSLADAVRAQGNYFPPDFVQMVDVGEKTGRLEIVMDRLATYYTNLANLKSGFVSSITWPIVQFLLAIVVIGLLIYVPAIVAPDVGDAADLLGFGLLGWSGLKTYMVYVGLFFAVVGILFFLGRNGFFSFLVHWLSYTPYFGFMFTVFAEARFVQTLALALESGLDTWNSVGLSFQSANSKLFRNKSNFAKTAVRQGRELNEVLKETALFSRDTIDAVQLGEETGRLPEVLDKHFVYLQSQSKNTLARFSYLASSFIWVVIAATLIFVIFRVFNNYMGSVDSAGETIINRTFGNPTAAE